MQLKNLIIAFVAFATSGLCSPAPYAMPGSASTPAEVAADVNLHRRDSGATLEKMLRVAENIGYCPFSRNPSSECDRITNVAQMGLNIMTRSAIKLSTACKGGDTKSCAELVEFTEFLFSS